MKTQALCLGLGSLFNHSTREQNVGWKRDLTARTITYTSLKDIQQGEELCIDYGRLWFHDADGDGHEEEDDENSTLGRIAIDL